MPCQLYSGFNVGGDTKWVAPPAGPDYSDITIHWNAENSAALDKGGLTGSSSGYDAISYDASVYQISSYSMKRTNNYDVIAFSDVSSITSHSSGQFGCWIYLNSVSDNLVLIRIDLNGSNDDTVRLRMQGTDDLELTHTGNNPYVSRSISTTGNTLSADTWYFVVCYWDKAASDTDTMRITIYNSSSVQIDYASGTASLTNPTSAINKLWVGSRDNQAGTFYIDNFIYTNDLTRNLNAVNNVTDFS